IVCFCVRAFHVCLLSPRSPASPEKVQRARILRRQIGFVAVDPLGPAVFKLRAHSESISIPADVQTGAKPILFSRMRRLDKSLLRPSGPVADENVNSAGRT